MKIGKLIFAGILGVALVNCSGDQATTVNGQDGQDGQDTIEATEPETAADIVDALKKAGLPIEKIQIMTAESDPNNLLGRPGQYISKASFFDGRYMEDANIEDASQNTIEVFDSEDEAKKRHDYVENIGKEMPMFLQYQILEGKILVRLDKVLTPDQAKEYETALKAIISS